MNSYKKLTLAFLIFCIPFFVMGAFRRAFEGTSSSASGTDATYSGTIQGGIITDGTASLSGGNLSAVGTLGATTVNATTITASGVLTGGSVTDGTATMASGSLTGVTSVTASGTVTAEHLGSSDDCEIIDDLTVGGDAAITGALSGGSVSDGTATLSSGSLGSAVNGTFSGTVQTVGLEKWDSSAKRFSVTTSGGGTDTDVILSFIDDDETETIMWDDGDDQFVVSDEFKVIGVLYVTSSITCDSNVNCVGLSSDYITAGSASLDIALRARNGKGVVLMEQADGTDRLKVTTSAASASDIDVILSFIDANQTETITWDEGEDRFIFSDAGTFEGPLRAATYSSSTPNRPATMAFGIADETADDSVLNSDTVLNETASFVRVDASGGNVTLTLPSVASTTAGKMYTFKATTSPGINTITIDGADAETIDGAATYTALDAQYDCVQIINTRTEWLITFERLN